METEENSFVVKALQRRYERTLGELEKAIKVVSGLEADLEYMAACIRMYRDDWQVTEATPRRPRRPNRWSGQRGIQMALDVLREAGEPLTAREITNRMLARRGITEVDPRSAKSVRDAVRAAMQPRLRDGSIIRLEKPIRYGLASS